MRARSQLTGLAIEKRVSIVRSGQAARSSSTAGPSAGCASREKQKAAAEAPARTRRDAEERLEQSLQDRRRQRRALVRHRREKTLSSVDADTVTGAVGRAVHQRVANRFDRAARCAPDRSHGRAIKIDLDRRSGQAERNSSTTCISAGARRLAVAVDSRRPPARRPRAKSSTLSIRSAMRRTLFCMSGTMVAPLYPQASPSPAAWRRHRWTPADCAGRGPGRR